MSETRRYAGVTWRIALLVGAATTSPLASADAQGARELPLRWVEAAAGVWRADVGTPEALSLLTTGGGSPRRDALSRMGAAAFPLPRADVRAFAHDGRVFIRLPLASTEQLYGLGLNYKTVQQRGTVKQLHVDHYGTADNGRSHAGVPFYVSSSGYGVLIDSPRYLTVYAGTAVRRDSKNPPPSKDRNTDRSWTSMPTSDGVEVLVPAAGARLYVFAGPTALDAVRRYNLYQGGGTLPPKWGLGFVHRVPTLYTAEKVLKEVDEFAKQRYPLDVIGLEPGWQSAAYPGSFVWDTTRFPDVAGFLTALRQRGVGTNLWFNPYVSPRAPFYKALEPLSGSHTVWTGIVPDYTLPATRRIIGDLFEREHLRLGVSGYKIDEVDGYDRWLWPDHAVFPSGLGGEPMRQIYAMTVQRATLDLFRKRDVRTYGLVRGTNAGAAPLPYVLYSDSYSHQDFITGLVNSGFIGVLWTPEVRSSRTSEEWLRRIQSVIFSPMAMLNAWNSGTTPWSFPDVADQVREAMQLRIKLLPYLYSAFAKYHFEGTPPFRAMALVPGFRPDPPSGQDETPEYQAAVRNARRDLKDQFMVGDELLVAPMFAGDTVRTVVLPPGRWYDFHTGALAGQGIITVRPGLARIPLFVRDGGIVPLIAGTPMRIPTAADTVDLEVRHYGAAAGRFDLYDDDGTTFAYERGTYSWTPLIVTRDAAGALRGTAPQRPAGRPFNYRNVTWTMMSPR